MIRQHDLPLGQTSPQWLKGLLALVPHPLPWQLKEGRRPGRLKAGAAPRPCSPIPGASSGHKSAWRLPFLLCIPLNRAVLVKNLPRPLPLALCPRAVGGAPASLVGAGQTCASLAALAALSLTGDRRIVLRRGRQLGAPAHPLSSSPGAWGVGGGERLVAGAPGTLKTPARRVSAGGGRQAGCRCGRPRVRGPEGESQSRPVGPESSRNAGGRRVRPQIRRAGLQPPRGAAAWPPPSYLARRDKDACAAFGSFKLPRLSDCEETAGPTQGESAVSSRQELFRV